jgi:HEAT repeat protein
MRLSLQILLASAILATIVGVASPQVKQPAAGSLQTKSLTSPGNKTPEEVTGKSMKEWIKEISSTDPSRRENAIRTVTLFPWAAVEALPAILERIDRDTDTSPKVNAIMALGVIEPQTEEDVKKVVGTLRKHVTKLNESQNIIRFQAALVLGRYGGRARPAMNELIQATQDGGSWEIRKAAVFSLARAVFDDKQPVNSQAIEALVGRVPHRSELSAQVRLEAVMALGIIGALNTQDKAKVVAALERAESDPERMVGIWARVGLMAYKNDVSEKDMKVLIDFTKSKELPLRTHAARAMGTIASVGNPGPHFKPAIPALIAMLRDEQELAQITAIWSLKQIGPPAQAALPQLSQMYQQKDITEEGKALIKEAIEAIQGKKK